MANKRKTSSGGRKKPRHAHVTKARSRSRSSKRRASPHHEGEFPSTPSHGETQGNRFGSPITAPEFQEDRDDFVSEDEGEEDDIV
jgi:hypothetical protein